MLNDREITIIGFGSLLSEESARRTCPSLKNFRCGQVQNYVRSFNKVDPNSSRFDHQNIANWAFVDKPGFHTLVTLFEIANEDYPAFAKREGEYDLKYLEYKDENDVENEGIACCAFDTNQEFMHFLETAPIQKEHYYATTYLTYQGPIWRKDILPRPKYLAFCLEAAKKLGDHYLENMLEHSFLSDEVTPIKYYLQKSHSDLEHIKDIEWLKNHL